MRSGSVAGLMMGLGASLLVSCTVLAAGQHHGTSGAPKADHEGDHPPGAHCEETKPTSCETCLKPLVGNREVVLEEAGAGPKHHFRCIHCALVGANDWFTSDVTLYARSSSRGDPVEWRRRDGKWRVSPASTQVLAVPETDGECLDKHLVFADGAELRAYGKQHALASGHPAIAATDVVSILSAGKPAPPRQASCPVTGATVRPDPKTAWTVYKGQVYYFCCEKCKPAFTSDPAAYVGMDASPRSGCPHSLSGHCG